MSPDLLRQLLDYDPNSGAMLWRPRPIELFTKAHYARTWNKRFAGQPALASLSDRGYLRGSICGRIVLAHRIAWLIYHNQPAPRVIDHLDQNPANNRIANLRDGTGGINQRNTARRYDNKSGHTGVDFHAQMWRARINHNGAPTYLGHYRTINAAIEARRAAASQLGYSTTHGTTQKEAPNAR
jgi:hypothetical protein